MRAQICFKRCTKLGTRSREFAVKSAKSAAFSAHRRWIRDQGRSPINKVLVNKHRRAPATCGCAKCRLGLSRKL